MLLNVYSRQLYFEQLNTEIMLLSGKLLSVLDCFLCLSQELRNHYHLALCRMYLHWQCLIKHLKAKNAGYGRV